MPPTSIPLPWYLAADTSERYPDESHRPIWGNYAIHDGYDDLIVVVPGRVHAELIVRAVNAHDALVAIARDYVAECEATMEDPDAMSEPWINRYEACKAALAKAGEPPCKS